MIIIHFCCIVASSTAMNIWNLLEHSCKSSSAEQPVLKEKEKKNATGCSYVLNSLSSKEAV